MYPGVEFAPLQLMLQSLLADRFNLRAHFEERQTQVYALVREGQVDKLTPIEPCSADNPCGIRSMRPGGFSARGSLAFLASHLGQITGRTVTDETGAVGAFDINLHWSPDQDAVDAISIFAALSDQLGLRLETRKGVASMLVIDSVDRPTSD